MSVMRVANGCYETCAGWVCGGILACVSVYLCLFGFDGLAVSL